jgi:hypothetical protein
MSRSGRYVLFHSDPTLPGDQGLLLIDRGPIAHHRIRNGSGSNELRLSGVQPPVLGATWDTVVDLSGHPGASVAILFGHGAPALGPTLAIGELLVDVTAPQLFLAAAGSVGGTASFSLAVPNTPSLLGFTAHAQGLILGGGTPELVNAMAATAGN